MMTIFKKYWWAFAAAVVLILILVLSKKKNKAPRNNYTVEVQGGGVELFNPTPYVDELENELCGGWNVTLGSGVDDMYEKVANLSDAKLAVITAEWRRRNLCKKSLYEALNSITYYFQSEYAAARDALKTRLSNANLTN